MVELEQLDEEEVEWELLEVEEQPKEGERRSIGGRRR